MQNTTNRDTNRSEPDATPKTVNEEQRPRGETSALEAAEVRVLGNEVFQQPIESLIRTSADTRRAVFLSGVFGDTTPYLIVCLASDEPNSIKIAQMLVEDLVCGEHAPAAHPGLRQKAWRKYCANRQSSAEISDTG